MSYIIVNLNDNTSFIINDYDLFYKYYVISTINSDSIRYGLDGAIKYIDYQNIQDYYTFVIHLEELIRLYNYKKYQEAFYYINENMPEYSIKGIKIMKIGDQKFPTINENIIKNIYNYFKMKVFK